MQSLQTELKLNYAVYARPNASLIKHQGCCHVETNQLIYRANEVPGVDMMPTLVFNELSNEHSG